MRRDVSELPFQPGGVNWASEKCNAGPHKGDSQETYHPGVRTIEQIFRIGAVVVPYSGTETSFLEKPVNPSTAVLYTRRAHLPA